MTTDEAKAEFWRQWAIDGMAGDKKRLAEAAWNAALAAAPSPPSGWLSIESAPDDMLILVTGLNFGRGPERHFAIASCAHGIFRDDSDGHDLEYVDHWMPLPPPPEDK